MNREQRIAKLEEFAQAQAKAISHLLQANTAQRGMLFAIARRAGLSRDDLHHDCSTFAEALIAGGAKVPPEHAIAFVAELNRTLGEYEGLLASVKS